MYLQSYFMKIKLCHSTNINRLAWQRVGWNGQVPTLLQRTEHFHAHCLISLDYLICVAKL